MSFEKPGRPRNDPAEERIRIYAAALPAIRRHGARARMDSMARLANISVGGLYHYFDSKQSLLLHGLNPEALGLACHTFETQMSEGAKKGPNEVASVYVDRTIYIFRLIKPAIAAAAELGVAEMQSQLAKTLQQDADGLVETLGKVVPQLDDESQVELAAAIRRTLLALSLDPTATEEDVRTQLSTVLRGHIHLREPITR